MAGKIRIIQKRGLSGCTQRQIDTVRGLGLRKIRHAVEQNKTPAVLGMVKTVSHLVTIEEI
ncbi:MAG: 50S ribosomal protein L30 [Candidatus Raymondbacteria bacterium RifOxyA12_full_50_37]|uniref:50S ribosomal protein L30 n=1 Tax=Candidatus Raymondbacteria bacterium RIFOXYD12_FULL_49_13 TaxID=1817890 RepID=A0A1F7FD98_UNCRA|nr:MAG: 50S ribosomal protein L30 [Candidatus Raymondbacteria bacterium RifOxyA12_full_50_37]OGJ94072.1 MAG: 50S ribosomal protein L30 [Candidatus Raymondbacteria bacterium RIFOXYA2_FULL_49_16]OGJ96827.1 MAG: 50S ribosomal protein L30 [Candidatus Raymondbacteria bacterium RifOxyC12_full_50_8]OGJ96897.1 MAG: 50S ribosomal protein L30 [Candidatus Raymondbacteria bacterium RIFOXYC2_FULL_50_21]OGK01513.1 MAG: 50S ribosomal protein L30 [Candidatus Raymondbacteria bacterium RifOxyB12_full_50_8]OGK04